MTRSENMKGKVILFLLMYSFALNTWAQEDTLRIVRDSLRMMRETSSGMSITSLQFPVDEPMIPSLPKTLPTDSSITYHFRKPSLLLPYYANPSPMFKGDFDTNGILFTHRYGMLIGTGNQTSLPGIGRSNDISFTYIHSFHPQWIFSVGVNVNKMHMSHFTGQSLGASGTLSYRANDRLTLNVFGGYHSGYVPGRQSYHFGGTIGMDISEHFGMEMGVQRYYNPLRSGWETVPIATPYYKFNNGAKFGFDVGGLLYEIFRDNSFKREIRNGNFSNPTIAPHRPRIEIR